MRHISRSDKGPLRSVVRVLEPRARGKRGASVVLLECGHNGLSWPGSLAVDGSDDPRIPLRAKAHCRTCGELEAKARKTRDGGTVLDPYCSFCGSSRGKHTNLTLYESHLGRGKIDRRRREHWRVNDDAVPELVVRICLKCVERYYRAAWGAGLIQR